MCVNFEEFWRGLEDDFSKKSAPAKFHTLKRYKAFDARFEHDKKGKLFVRIIPESGKHWRAYPYTFEGVWKNASGKPQKTRFVNHGRRLGTYTKPDGKVTTAFSLSYILALIDHIVGNDSME